MSIKVRISIVMCFILRVWGDFEGGSRFLGEFWGEFWGQFWGQILIDFGVRFGVRFWVWGQIWDLALWISIVL
jgi:hypothetical protein